MPGIYLQRMAEAIPWESMPATWTELDLAGFSKNKQLWDYQQTALANAVRVLWKYYESLASYQASETLENNQDRKAGLYDWYRDNGLEEDLDIHLTHTTKANRRIARLLAEHYPVDDSRASYQHFINRMSFWMATGSGKTLVIVKLIQILWTQIQRGEIPPYDILVLTHRDDLLRQLETHVREFNQSNSDLYIKLRDLKEQAAVKRENPSLFQRQELTVFTYRSDNLSDEQKEKIIDYRNYDDQGRFYVLLDEAHKGDREDSKRQHIYSILARNGFLFNFSATFTDPRDIATTVANFNLSPFIRAGYGKHIAILRQEIRAFRQDEDYTYAEKQKVVLKSLILLAYARHFCEAVRAVGAGLYHKPMLLTLVNSVNTEDADLRLFFRELTRIGNGQIDEAVWQEAKRELRQEFDENPAYLFEEEPRIKLDRAVFDQLAQLDLWRDVFNANGPGEIEVLVRPSKQQEVAFKLKTGDSPFALIKIGDISGWLKNELAGYEINEHFNDESYFERLNQEDSEINILMGSRSFYEGWDSNRPNIITYINIGTGVDAKKFILQSVGRGVRIEPLKNQRKRILELYNAGLVEKNLFGILKGKVLPLESLFIFGTNRAALNTVIGELDQERRRTGEHELALTVNSEAILGHKMRIPTYQPADEALYKQGGLAKFALTPVDLDLLQRYVDYIGDERVLLALHEPAPERIAALQDSLKTPDNYYRQDGRPFKNVDVLMRQTFNYFGVQARAFDHWKELEDEIRHFRHIKVFLQDIGDLELRIQRVASYPTLIRELQAKFEARQLSFIEMLAQTRDLRETEQFTPDGRSIDIRRIEQHYYIPILLAEDARIDYIQHIIKTPSEVRFIRKLEDYLEQDSNLFKKFDWWVFSKIDESLDDVAIPYYDPAFNRIREFLPDFIFWLQQENNYHILFVDPKGSEYTHYEHKLEGYKAIFEDNGVQKLFDFKGLCVKVSLFLFTSDVNAIPPGYRQYWCDNLDMIIKGILEQ